MKQLVITVISLYQIILSPIFKQLLGVKSQCRYSPSCSVYAKQVISDYGSIKGLHLALRRILSCQPFAHAYGHN
jgi:putative membrane protein insertion efficiency factor